MKVTVLAENSTCREDLTPQHGLSLYIETNGKKILFDMGQDDTFARNAKTLGIDLSQVDWAIISHGHYDHGGGLDTFLKINSNAPVYVHEAAFGRHYNGTEKYIGLDLSFHNHSRLIFTKGTVKISPQILLTDCNDLGWISNSFGLKRVEGEVFYNDDFLHEQYLQITEKQRKILVSGCSHKDIVNIVRHFLPDVLIGGFHLNKVEESKELEQITQILKSAGGLYYTGHCTGNSQFEIMKQIMGESLWNFSTGTVIEI